MPIETWILVLNLASTGVMIGIIWFVQVVHYPLMGLAGHQGFGMYARAHGRLTAVIVAPPMLLEAGTGALLLVWRPAAIPAGAAWAGLGLIALLWASTAFLQVPQHDTLSRHWDAAAHRRLVRTNWLRTVLWTTRGILVLWMLVRLLEN
jgi:hypothetical protein